MRTRPVAVLIVALLLSGCFGVPNGGSTAEPTETTVEPTTDVTAEPTPAGPPSGRVDFPDGPKERPERPATLNDSSVRTYVERYEYRYAHNSLWMNEYTDVTLDCRIDDVTERPWGYAAVVTCTGYSNTDVPENATTTATAGPHADWFTQTYRYLVSGDATERRRIENREPAG